MLILSDGLFQNRDNASSNSRSNTSSNSRSNIYQTVYFGNREPWQYDREAVTVRERVDEGNFSEIFIASIRSRPEIMAIKKLKCKSIQVDSSFKCHTP